jgi:hypothetical protein
VVDLPQEFGGILVHQWRRVVGRIRLKPVWSALAIVATIASGVIAPCFISTDAAQAVTPSEFSSAPTPTITGDLSVGSTLTVNPGAWNPSPSFTYQWVRDGLPIKNGTSSTYTLVPADYAKSVSVRVVGSKPGFIQILRMSLSSARVSAGAYSPTIGSDFAGQISAGGYHSCAVQLSGQVQCVGENFDGQLGNGWLTNSSIPVTVSGITTAVSVTAGGRHSCAVLVDGTVECWGSDFWGQLGNGLTARFVPTPVRVSGITTAVSVTAGTGHSCAVLVGGAVKCWGHNSGGQLGNGSNTNSSTPVWSTGFGSSQVLTPTPSFSGTAAVGSTLTAVPGTWDAGVSFSYQWKRAGVVIPSATGSTYVIQNDDAGKTLTVVVTGSKAGFVSVSKTSASTSSVLLAGLVPTFSTPVKTATGFTVNVTNYNAAFTFTPIISVGSGTVTAGTASGTTLPLTVSGVTAGATTVTVATTRLNYATGTGTIASAAKPVISSLTSGGSAAATVLRGASVTITGSNFSGATSVTIGGVAAPKFTVTSPTTIVVGVWATAITGVVRVETPGGTAVSTGSLTISSTLRAPTLAVSGALSASTGGRGTAVTVTGTNLGSVTQVMRGTVAVPFVVLSETQIVLAVPSGLATGTLVFTTAGGSVTSGTFTASPSAVVPTVTSTGLSGKVGTVLTIAGTNLGAVTGVSIGGLAVTNWWVKDAGRLSILVPPTAGLGAVNVVVTTAGGAVTTPATITG